jgi:hypothetical protein
VLHAAHGRKLPALRVGEDRRGRRSGLSLHKDNIKKLQTVRLAVDLDLDRWLLHFASLSARERE